MNSEVAERYAAGLFELAKENGTVEQKRKQAQDLLVVTRENDDLKIFLRAVKVTKDEKKAFLENLFKESLDEDMIRFLKLLVDKDRAMEMNEILKQFIFLTAGELGIEEAIVYSARKLSEEDLTRIKEALEKKRNKTILLSNKIDPSLIAGIKVKVGNTVTDISTKYQIESLKQSLLKGGLV